MRYTSRMPRIVLAFLLLLSTPGHAAAPCVLTGGGCLRVEGPGPRHTSAFGGTVPGAWQHVYYEGHTVLVRIDAADAVITRCRPEPGGGCRASRAEFEGSCTVTLGDQPPFAGNYNVEVIDGGCPSARDHYAITVRRGSIAGMGEVAYEAEGDLGCGNLRIEAPWAKPEE